MPVIKSAKKKLRQDKKRTARNRKMKETLKLALRAARENPKTENINAAYSVLDRAAQKSIIHKNKAARLKSKLGKLKKPVQKTVKTKKKKAVKKAVKKTAAKKTKSK